MRLRHVLYLGCSILLLVFALAILWEFAFEDWLLASDFATSHQGESTAGRWGHVATATGVALAALMAPLWVAAVAIRGR